MIPDKKTCYLLLAKYRFPEKKLVHVKKVAQVASYLASKLNALNSPLNGQNSKYKINENLILAAALLHDLDKGIPGAGKTHPKEAVKMLRSEGCLEVAEIVAKHSLPTILDKEGKPKTWEEKIVFLSDKMAKNKVMTVDDRFSLWRAENIRELDKILDQTYPKVKELEREILGLISIKAENIVRILNSGI